MAVNLLVVIIYFWTFSNIFLFVYRRREKYHRREVDQERFPCTVKLFRRAQSASSDIEDIEKRIDRYSLYRRSGIVGNP